MLTIELSPRECRLLLLAMVELEEFIEAYVVRRAGAQAARY